MIRAIAGGSKISSIKLARYNRKKRALLSYRSFHRNTKIIIPFIILIFIGLAVNKAYSFITTSPLFFVNEIDIEGSRVLEREILLRTAGIKPGQNIFVLNIPDVVYRLKSIPLIRDVVVSRKLPDRLHIRIEERVSSAILRSGKSYFIDKDGVILREMHDEDVVALPVIEDKENIYKKPGDKVESSFFFEAHDLIYAFSKSPFIRNRGISVIKLVENNKIVLLTTKDKISVIFDRFLIADGLRKFNIIADLIVDKPIKIVDLSFVGQVVVSSGKN